MAREEYWFLGKGRNDGSQRLTIYEDIPNLG